MIPILIIHSDRKVITTSYNLVHLNSIYYYISVSSPYTLPPIRTSRTDFSTDLAQGSGVKVSLKPPQFLTFLLTCIRLLVPREGLSQGPEALLSTFLLINPPIVGLAKKFIHGFCIILNELFGHQYFRYFQEEFLIVTFAFQF